MNTWRKRIIGIAVAVVVLIGAVLVGSAVHLLPQLRNPFGETTKESSGPVLLQSIVELSRYEAASGTFQVVVDISSGGSLLPSFLEGSDTMFIGVGTDNAYVDFSHLKGDAVQSYVFAQQQGLFTRVNQFLSGNPNSQQSVYELAQKQIQGAAAKSQLVADAERNTKAMLVSLLQSLGFKTINVTFGAATP
jgi:hypothetical protein